MRRFLASLQLPDLCENVRLVCRAGNPKLSHVRKLQVHQYAAVDSLLLKGASILG
jgi:hypothetical protein